VPTGALTEYGSMPDANMAPFRRVFPSNRLSPEATLRLIFEQAFGGQPLTLPPGTTAATLRAALALDSYIIAAIFQDVRAHSTKRQPSAGPDPAPPPAAKAAPADPFDYELLAPKSAAAALPDMRGLAERPELPDSAPATAALPKFATTPPAKPARRSSALALALAVVILAGGFALVPRLTHHIPLPLRAALPAAPAAPPPVDTAALAGPAATKPAALAALTARANKGDTLAQYDLAALYDTDGIPHVTSLKKNDATAANWIKKAAAAGYPPAESKLADDYRTGHGIAANQALAINFDRLAAAAGLADAQNNLGQIYQQAIGVKEDDVQALHLFQQAAGQGLPAAEDNLGEAYLSGRGTPMDPPTAAAWLARAAAAGDENAENSLGYMYYLGLGVTADPARAATLFRQAAVQGLATAALNLGICYADGRGVPQDDLQAAIWLLRAQARGDAQSATLLAQILPQLTADEVAAARTAAAGS
jgi:TPR repeat protein